MCTSAVAQIRRNLLFSTQAFTNGATARLDGGFTVRMTGEFAAKTHTGALLANQRRRGTKLKSSLGRQSAQLSYCQMQALIRHCAPPPAR